MPTLIRKRPVVRRIGMLVVRLDHQGVSIRKYRGRKWRLVTWRQIATLALENEPTKPAGCLAREWDEPLQALGVEYVRLKSAGK